MFIQTRDISKGEREREKDRGEVRGGCQTLPYHSTFTGLARQGESHVQQRKSSSRPVVQAKVTLRTGYIHHLRP